MRAITGLLSRSQGEVRVAGRYPRGDRSVFRRVALVPEDDAVPNGLTPRQLCRYVADLHRVEDRSIVEWALHAVEMTSVADRAMVGFSKGMRQRSKVAAALVTNPLVLRSEEHTSELQSLMRISYAVFCLKTKKAQHRQTKTHTN